MSSGYSPWWKRKLKKYCKWLFIVCPEGNYHWYWDYICYCQDYNDRLVFDMKHKKYKVLKRWEDFHD